MPAGSDGRLHSTTSEAVLLLAEPPLPLAEHQLATAVVRHLVAAVLVAVPAAVSAVVPMAVPTMSPAAELAAMLVAMLAVANDVSLTCCG